jgi:hypothetical protein
MAQGLNNTEISQMMEVSYQTTKNNITNIIQKTGMGNRTLLAFYALKRGYVTQQQIDNAINGCIANAKEEQGEGNV